METEKAPLQAFADTIKDSPNPIDIFHSMGNSFKEGDKVRGTWVDFDGKTYHQKGIIIRNEKTGLWVQTEPDGGITEVKRFWTMYYQSIEPHNPPRPKGDYPVA